MTFFLAKPTGVRFLNVRFGTSYIMGLIGFVLLLGTFAKLSFLVVRGRSLARNTFAMGKLLY